MPWLDDLLESTNELESPRRYFLWSGLCAISAVVKDHVYVNRGNAYTLHPNLYVILYGPTGLRKGLPIALARDLVSIVGNTRVISGRSSIEAILQELGTARSTPKGMISDSAGFIVSSEFASSIVRNPTAITILTDLYDRIYNTGEWKNLIKSGPDKLKRPIVTLLGGANEAQFKDILTTRDVEGGFLGRTFVISETKRHTLNSLARPITNPPNREKLAQYLAELSKLKGEFSVSDEALGFFDEWYQDTFSDGAEDPTGTLLRMGDIVFRVAMLLALSIAPELKIGKSMIEAAITLTEPLVPSAQRTTHGQGKSSMAAQTAKFIEVLIRTETHRMSREDILRRNWRDFDSLDLDRIVLTLTDSNVIMASVEEKGRVYYELTSDAVEQIEQMKHRRRK